MMKLIEEIIDDIYDELAGAEDYMDRAIKYKEEMPEISEMYHNMSLIETEHMNNLHDAIVKIIAQYRLEIGEPPPEMQAVYDYEHKRIIKKAQDVKILQSLY